MAFKIVVVATLVALVSAGMDADYMNMMMQNMMNMQNMNNMNNHNNNGNGCNPATGGCNIPTGIDLGDYLQQQQQQQQYEREQMAEKVKAQFEGIMRQVTMKKHRYAMTVMTEFTSMCACANEAYNIYQTMFVENAKALNLTDVEDLDAGNQLPYQATSAKEARELMFGGLFYNMCVALGNYMTFIAQVEANIPVFENNPTTAAPQG